MFKATSTFTQARNITIALTMSFAATTLVTACDSDDSADTAQTPEVEMSSENQNNMTEDNSQVTLDNQDTMDSEPVEEPEMSEATVEEPEVTEATVEVDNTNASASDDDSMAQANEPTSDEPETHTVNAQGLIFAPLVVEIKPGDSVAWRNMNTHNSESIDGLIPEGAEKWSSPISKSYKRTFTQEGIYVYKCTPHFGTGMGGAIIVGEPVNLEEIKNADVSGAAGRLVRKAISAAESM